MSRKSEAKTAIGIWILGAVLLIGFVFLVAALEGRKDKEAVPATPFTKTTAYQSVPGLDLVRLPEEEREKLLSHLNHTACSCNCKMTVAECRNVDPSCDHSKEIAELNFRRLLTQTVDSPVLSVKTAH